MIAARPAHLVIPKALTILQLAVRVAGIMT